MHLEETFAGKAAAQGKNRVVDFGVFVLETLGAVGLPAEQVASALFSLRPIKQTDSSSKGAQKTESRPKRKPKHINKRKRNEKEKEKEKDKDKEKAQTAGRSDAYRKDIIRKDISHECSPLNKDNKSKHLIHWALRLVIEVRSRTPQQVISRVLFYLADALGDSLDQPSQRDLERAVGAFVEEAAQYNRGQQGVPPSLNRAVNGIVLSYSERDDMSLSPSILRKIRRGMHFEIPIRPFDATVKLLPPPSSKMDRKDREGRSRNKSSVVQPRLEDIDVDNLTWESKYCLDLSWQTHDSEETQDLIGRMMANRRCMDANPEYLVPCTPSSFPPTPSSRTAHMDNIFEFTENVLYMARDELRGEQEENDRPRIAIFDPEDCHPKIVLSCGGHCAMLEEFHCEADDQFFYPTAEPSSPFATQSTIYRSVRAALSIQQDHVTYFEMCPLWASSDPAEALDQSISVCVGLSTKAMPLRDTVPGFATNSVGLDSSGIFLLAGKKRRTEFAFSCGSVVGVCVYIRNSRVTVNFFVDGEPVLCDDGDFTDEPSADPKNCFTGFTINEEQGQAPVAVYPTASIKSANIKLFCHFSEADMRYPSSDNEFWSPVAEMYPGQTVYALDGTELLRPSKSARTPLRNNPVT